MASHEASTSSLQAGSATSQKASADWSLVTPSQAGSHLPQDSTASQEGVARSQAVRHSTRLIQAGSRSGSGYMHSARLRASQASQGDNTTSQASSANPQGGNIPQGSSMEGPNPKWVINLSSKPLTPAQRSVLSKGPNFAVTISHPPNLEYIPAIESACTKLSQQNAEELRADINQVLTSYPPPNLI